MENDSTSVPATFMSSANQTNDTWCSAGRTEKWTQDVIQAYILLISVLGILLNLFVLMVLWFHKKPCTVAEIYLGNLAAADLLLMSFLPFWAVTLPNNFNWPFGGAMCRLVNLSIMMNMYCSIYSLVLVSMDRYSALVKPLTSERMRTPKCAKLGCLLVWGLGLLLSIPTIIYREVEHFPRLNFTLCYFKYPDQKAFLLSEVLLTTFSFIIPIPIISYCTWEIIRALNNRLPKNIQDHAEKKKKEQEKKATTLILAVLLAFLICFVPLHLVRILELLHRVKVLKGCRLHAVIGICKQIFMYFAYFNSVLNPILYVIVGKNFQKKVKEVCFPSARKKIGTLSRTSVHTFAMSYRKSFKSESVRY